MNALRKLALAYPEAEEGVACEGTALEKRTVKVRNKAFLFLGAKDLMLKLGESLAEAAKLAAKEPARYQVGSSGWVKVILIGDTSPPLDLLERWVDESFRMLAPAQLAATLPGRNAPTTAKKKAPKRARKKAGSR